MIPDCEGTIDVRYVSKTLINSYVRYVKAFSIYLIKLVCFKRYQN